MATHWDWLAIAPLLPSCTCLERMCSRIRELGALPPFTNIHSSFRYYHAQYTVPLDYALALAGGVGDAPQSRAANPVLKSFSLRRMASDAMIEDILTTGAARFS